VHLSFVTKPKRITIPLLTTSLNSNYTTVQTGTQLYAKIIHIIKWEPTSFIHTCLSSCMGTGISAAPPGLLQITLFFYIFSNNYISVTKQPHRPKFPPPQTFHKHWKTKFLAHFTFITLHTTKTWPHFPRPWSGHRSTLSHFSLFITFLIHFHSPSSQSILPS